MLTRIRNLRPARPPPKPVSRPPAPKPTPAPTPAPPPVTPGLKRALLVGINYYKTDYELAGCINDVTNMQSRLRSFFPTCKEYRFLTDAQGQPKPSKSAILTGITWLVSGLRSGENVYFHYSGHGGLVRDTNGDEVSGKDSCIYPINAANQLEIITDDELRTALANKIPVGCKCFVVIDACHSGTAVDLRYTLESPAENVVQITEDKKYAKTTGSVLFLSGAKDTQTAADTVDKSGRPCGAMTMALLDTWSKYGAAIKTKYILWDIRKYLKENGYDQVPVLTSGNAIDINQVFDLGKA
jgi:hypothetical protein